VIPGRILLVLQTPLNIRSSIMTPDGPSAVGFPKLPLERGGNPGEVIVVIRRQSH